MTKRAEKFHEVDSSCMYSTCLLMGSRSALRVFLLVEICMDRKHTRNLHFKSRCPQWFLIILD